MRNLHFLIGYLSSVTGLGYVEDNFICSCIVAGVPESWYFDVVLSKDAMFRGYLFEFIFSHAIFFEDDKETLRIYTILADIINRIPAN